MDTAPGRCRARIKPWCPHGGRATGRYIRLREGEGVSFKIGGCFMLHPYIQQGVTTPLAENMRYNGVFHVTSPSSRYETLAHVASRPCSGVTFVTRPFILIAVTRTLEAGAASSSAS